MSPTERGKFTNTHHSFVVTSDDGSRDVMHISDGTNEASRFVAKYLEQNTELPKQITKLCEQLCQDIMSNAQHIDKSDIERAVERELENLVRGY